MSNTAISEELKKRVKENLPIGLSDKALALALNNWELSFTDFQKAIDFYKETKS